MYSHTANRWSLREARRKTFLAMMKTSETGDRYHFASDNTAGICPEAWEALQACNDGQVASYGTDDWTEEACNLIRDVFEKPDAEIFFVFNGTAANSLALSSLCQSYHSVICHELAHVETDECGAVEFFSNGTKLLLAGGAGAKVSPQAIRKLVTKRADIHYPKPRVVTVTQATELGTIYTPAELSEISEVAGEYGLAMHMDGARFANAVAALGVSPAEASWRSGVDVLCLGGTKNGMSGTEAVVFFKPELAAEFDYRCKQAGQLASKMRFVSAQWLGMLKDGAWLRNASRANGMAKRLARELSGCEGVLSVSDPQANAVFVAFAAEVEARLLEQGWHFYNFIGGGSRLMCSWKTTEADVDAFVAAVRSLGKA